LSIFLNETLHIILIYWQ